MQYTTPFSNFYRPGTTKNAPNVSATMDIVSLEKETAIRLIPVHSVEVARSTKRGVRTLKRRDACAMVDKEGCLFLNSVGGVAQPASLDAVDL